MSVCGGGGGYARHLNLLGGTRCGVVNDKVMASVRDSEVWGFPVWSFVFEVKVLGSRRFRASGFRACDIDCGL